MTKENYFISNNEFEGEELFCNRSKIAHQYLSGKGVEIGALHKPLQIDEEKCFVSYLDYKTREENRARYPELNDEAIVYTNIVDDGFTLNKVRDNSQDFIIANHALEHSPDPYGTLLRWRSKLKTNGLVYAAIPIGEKCYDKGRPATSLDHFLHDHKIFTSGDKNEILKVTKQHIEEFIDISGYNIRIMNNMERANPDDNARLLYDLLEGLKIEMETAEGYDTLISAHVKKVNRIYDIHYHVFTPMSYEIFLLKFCDDTDSILENVIKNGSGECIGIIRRK